MTHQSLKFIKLGKPNTPLDVTYDGSVHGRAATAEAPDAMRVMFADAAGVSDAKFEELKKGLLEDLGRPGANMVNPHHIPAYGCIANCPCHYRRSPSFIIGLGRSEHTMERQHRRGMGHVKESKSGLGEVT